MITPAYVRRMASYNRWQNQNLYQAAGALTDAQRKEPRGAFFGSIHGTLNHLLWADQIWLSRFAGTPKPSAPDIPASVGMHAEWGALVREREAFDQVIIDWAETVDQPWLDRSLTYYSGAAGREITKPHSLLVTHYFNHQTHHRGQVHCLLTQFGVRPGATDLPFQPD
jgi:uncharacterized damage-inducible protein DinB